MEIQNGIIKNVTLTMEDHGCLTFWLTIEGNGMGFGYGGYNIGTGYLGANDFSGSAKGLEAMMRIMDVVGVSCWEDLVGKYIRFEYENHFTPITKIGNIIKDHWFDIKKFFQEDK